MNVGRNQTGPCFLAASDESFRFADSPQPCDGLGAFVHRIDDAALADSLIELYKAECPDRAFDLVVVSAKSLTAHQLVLVNREIGRGESIGLKSESNEFRTSDATFAAIGRCIVTLGRLEDELRHVLEDSASAKVTVVGHEAYSVRHRLFPPLTPPQSLQEAFDRLAYVLERHRLVFLHFAGAVRRNPNAVGGPTGIYERVRTEEILGHKQYYEQVDSEGEFLFKNRWFLDRYADEAISRFGPGEGNKPDVEGATHPYWSLDETGAGYLQESADLIHACAGWLRSFDTRTACDQLVSDCLSIA
jgi:hypothetical protein